MTYLSPKWAPRRALVAVLVCALVAGVAEPRAHGQAGAESEAARAKAKALLQEGARFMDQRQYERAVESFRDAYRLVPSPKVLYNLGVAYLSVARYAEALAALEGFLKEATDAPVANQEAARRHVADLRAKVSTLALTGDRQRAELILDGRSLGERSLGEELTIDAGPHDLRAIAGNRVAEQRFTAPAGGRLAIVLTFDEQPAAGTPPALAAAPAAAATAPALVAAPEEHRPLVRQPWFWAAAGGAVAVATTVILIFALSKTEYPTPDGMVPGP